MVADVLRELALDSNSDIEPSDTHQSAAFVPNESDSNQMALKVKMSINQVQVLVSKF